MPAQGGKPADIYQQILAAQKGAQRVPPGLTQAQVYELQGQQQAALLAQQQAQAVAAQQQQQQQQQYAVYQQQLQQQAALQQAAAQQQAYEQQQYNPYALQGGQVNAYSQGSQHPAAMSAAVYPEQGSPQTPYQQAFYPPGYEPQQQDASQDLSQARAHLIDKEKRYEGQVKTYNIPNGFGFITCPELFQLFERDVFFNRFIEGAERIEVGMGVTFLVTLNDKGQPQATDLKLNATSAKLHAKAKAPPVDKVFTGTVRTFNSNLGYGFITCHEIKDQYDRDVFCHKQQFNNMDIGDSVTFKVQMNAKGQPQARDLQKVADPATLQEGGNETVLDPPEGKVKYTGRLRGFNKEQGFAFLDSEDAQKKFGHADVFLHKSHCPPNLDMSLHDELFFEFDVVMVKGRPQARNLIKITAPKVAGLADNMSPVKIQVK